MFPGQGLEGLLAWIACTVHVVGGSRDTVVSSRESVSLLSLPRKSSGHINDKGKNVRQRNAN